MRRDWAAWAVFGFFAVSFALHPYSPFFTHRFADPDDVMRLARVADWMSGQGWFFSSVPRLSPGAGTVIHWSRLIDLPIAAVALPWRGAVGLIPALTVASWLAPLGWLVVLLALIAAMERAARGADRAVLSPWFFLFMPLLAFQYTPGRVDHHGVQAIIAGFELFCLGQMTENRRGVFYAAAAALAAACGFWIGTEALPWAILLIACLAVTGAGRGGAVARHAAAFGVFLPLSTALLLPLALPASEFSSRALSWFSPAYLFFAILAGGVLVLGWAAGRKMHRPWARLAVYAGLGTAAAAGFFALVPAAINGPFADYDAFDATTALDGISEAIPMIRSFIAHPFAPGRWAVDAGLFGRYLFLPFAALAGCAAAARSEDGARRAIWIAQGVFLTAAAGMTLFWQTRVGIFMELFALTPLAWLAARLSDLIGRRLRGRPLFWAEVALFALLGPLPVLLIPDAIAQRPLYPDIVLFPAARGAPVCDSAPVLDVLNEKDGLGARPHTIMNVSDAGPDLMLYTRHNAVSGNFNVAGNADAYAFFRATDDEAARAALRRWNADLVLVCRAAPALYLGRDYYSLNHSALKEGKDGMLRLANTDALQPLIARLTRGEGPGWLRPIDIPGRSDYLLFSFQE